MSPIVLPKSSAQTAPLSRVIYVWKAVCIATSSRPPIAVDKDLPVLSPQLYNKPRADTSQLARKAGDEVGVVQILAQSSRARALSCQRRSSSHESSDSAP